MPAGTVTMLFSDIEGSTALLSRLGDRYGEALSEHRALLRAAFEAWQGREMDTEGDSFFVVFETAVDAVACCLAAQLALGAHDWPGGDAVRVRMGLHLGEPTRHEGGYIGMDVHRAARIAATAHGGQVVLSEPVLQQAGTLPEGVSVRDLGFHRLKDISAPERIYQLTGPGLREDFPALKSLGTQTSLPVPATPLVGRDADLERMLAVISRPGVRLITLTGPGGVGKTRLSLAAAAALDHAFPNGVFFVALAAVRDPGVMWKILAGDLDADGDGDDPAAVLEFLRNRRMLLVLDNLEQLGGAGEIVAALVAAAPGLVVLATSRGPLYVQGEHEFPVPPLEVAGGADVDAVAASPAVRLFAQHAAMVRPGFVVSGDNAADVAAICRRLDGLPLAIELAASRVRLLAPKALFARLGQSLGLATADPGRPSRQQTLRNVVAWSYDLLTPGTARVFRRMSVFAGGSDLDALGAVAGTGDRDLDLLELVAGLHDVSLITVTEGTDGEPRLGMLETIREYALERLEADDDADGTRRRHAEYYADVAERAYVQMDGPAQLTVLSRLEADHDNLRAALAWSLVNPTADPASQGDQALIGLRLVQALTTFWYQHGHATEGRRWLQLAMDLASGEGGAPLARVAHGLGVLMDQQGEPDAARRLFERSLGIWRKLGDRGQQARQLSSLGITYRHLGQLAKARAFLEEAVALNRETSDMARLADSLANLGQLESSLGRWDRAMEAVQEALVLDRQCGSPYGVAVDQHSLALATLRAGRPREARALVRDMLDYVASSGNTAFFVNTLELAAVIAGALDDHPLAARLLGAAQGARHESGMQITQPEADLLDELLAPARASTAAQEWDAWVADGRTLSQAEALALLRSLSPA